MSYNTRLRHPLRALMPALLPAVLALSSCNKQETTGLSQEQAPEVSYVIAKSEAVLLKNELPGRAAPYLVAEIRPQANGIVTKRLFTEGTDVQAGDVLYEIDPSSYQAAKDSATAAVHVAKANHSTSIAALSAAKAALNAAKATQTRAVANAEPLRLRTARFHELLASKAVSQQDYDDSAAALKQAEAGIESAAAGVISAEADVQRAEAAIKAAEAAIGSAEAALANADINLAYTKITAPISGRIGRSTVTTGALVSAHQPLPLATIQQLNPIYIDAPQAAADLLRLRRRLADGRLSHNGSYSGQASLLLEDNSEYALKGVVQFREVSVDPTTGSFVLRLVFANPKNELLPGMFVRAVIDEGVNSNAMLIPQQCVSRNASGDAIVMCIATDNTVHSRTVRIDRAVGNHWLISEGIQDGERIILEGLLRARPGMKVHALPHKDTSENAAAASNDSEKSPFADDAAANIDTPAAIDNSATTK
jgi:membrane fusion protein (multidrug efflux system)